MRTFKRLAMLGMAAGMTLLGGTAAAQQEPREQDFPACDGYAAPGRTTDGFSHGVSGLGAIAMGGTGAGQLRRFEPRYGQQGIDLCTRLLGYRWMLPQYTLRRASILEARALHRLAAGEAQEALADLDQARQSVTGSDALIDRSFLLGLGLVRAFARLKAGDANSAASESLAVLAARPYEPSLSMTAAKLHFAAARDWPAFARNLREIARIDPNALATLFTLAFYRGEFEEVVALYPQVLLSTPRTPEGGYNVPGLYAEIAGIVVRQAVLDGSYAYALQTRGHPEQADAAIAAARATLDRAMAPPVADFGRGRLTREQQDQHRAMLARRDEATQIIARWERMVRLRRMVAAGNVTGVVADVETQAIDPGPAALDLFEAMGQARPALRTEMASTLANLRQRLATEIDRALTLSVADVANALPEPETVQRMPSYDAGGDRDFDANGYQTLLGTRPESRVIRFASNRGSISTANEMALLRAAELARQTGARGILILRRRGVLRSTTSYYYNVPGATTASGQEAEIEVAFLNPASLPPAYQGAAWRVLDPEVIWSALSPIYVRNRPAAR